ncbi:hypothetical protein CW304_25700 [Bacillus sp. UFRGS-B20]|nr:hypothetical protein CW304_25700 [Bacillus sp. UFRGS-B20]
MGTLRVTAGKPEEGGDERKIIMPLMTGHTAKWTVAKSLAQDREVESNLIKPFSVSDCRLQLAYMKLNR